MNGNGFRVERGKFLVRSFVFPCLLLTAAVFGLCVGGAPAHGTAPTDSPVRHQFSDHEERSDHPRTTAQPNVALRSRREIRIHERLPFSAQRLTGDLAAADAATAWFCDRIIRPEPTDLLVGVLHCSEISRVRSRAPPIS